MSTIEVGRISCWQNKSGVEVSHWFYNAGKKAIKYLTFTYVPYNAVGDVVCTISKKTEISKKVTGPISPQHSAKTGWESALYDDPIERVVLTRVHIQFMDNTEETIEGKDIVSMDNPGSAYQPYFRESNAKSEAEFRALLAEREKEQRAEKAKLEEARRAREAKIAEAAKKLSNNEMTLDSISEILNEFKYPEDRLLAVLNAAKPGFITGYFIGDYIEKELPFVFQYSSLLKKKMVDIWIESLKKQYQVYKTPEAKKHKDLAKKYDEKIRKYNTYYPSYQLPKKPGCMSK